MGQTLTDIIVGNLLDIVLSIITAIIGIYIIPLIRNELTPWLRDRHIYSQVKTFVGAAEKLAEAGIIGKADKKAKVTELLEGCGIDVDEKVEAFIEGAVKQLDLLTSTITEEIRKDG